MADMPSPHQNLIEENGITKWRPLIEGLRIVALPDGERLIEIEIDGSRAAHFKLTRPQAGHLAHLLSPRAEEAGA